MSARELPPGDGFFLFVTLSTTFSYATPLEWYADVGLLCALMGIGFYVNAKHARRQW